MNKYTFALALFLVLFAGCFFCYESETTINYEARLFSGGDIVNHKLTSTKGMVVKAECNYKQSHVEGGCLYHVRFEGSAINANTRVFSGDEKMEVQPFYLAEDIRPFEIELVQNTTKG